MFLVFKNNDEILFSVEILKFSNIYIKYGKKSLIEINYEDEFKENNLFSIYNLIINNEKYKNVNNINLIHNNINYSIKSNSINYTGKIKKEKIIEKVYLNE